MQGVSPITVRIDPDLKFAPKASSGLVEAPYHEPGADVLVVRGGSAPPAVRSEAVLRVGDATSAWSETPTDLALTEEELVRDGEAAIRRARALRLALRPTVGDPTEARLAAIRTVLEADVVRVVDRDRPDVLAAVARAARVAPVTVGSAGDLAARFGPPTEGSAPALDGLRARALGPREQDGVLIVGVTAGGSAWLERTAPLAGRVLDAAALLWAEQRIRQLERREEETNSVMRRLLSVGGHDLSNLLFAANLGVAALQRQPAPPPAVAKVGRSIGGAVALLRRVVDTGMEILGGPDSGTGGAELLDVFDRVRDQLQQENPGRALHGSVPDTRVAVSDVVLERLLTVLLSNAVLHSDGPITVRGAVEADGVTVEIVNPGVLPFADAERISPFEHRTQRTLGAGLWSARRLAAANRGVDLRVTQEGQDVKAVLRLPLESVADMPA